MIDMHLADELHAVHINIVAREGLNNCVLTVKWATKISFGCLWHGLWAQ